MYLSLIVTLFIALPLANGRFYPSNFLSNDSNPVKNIKVPLADKIPIINGENPLAGIPTPTNWASDLLTDLAQALPALPGLDEVQTKCYEDLGCFSSHDFFHILNRPISMLPMSPEELNITFNLFTCNANNKYRPIKLKYNSDDESIRSSTFSSSNKTKIIIHGYRDSYDEMQWMGNMKDYILDRSCDYNVFGLDWSKGSKVANYLLAAANTRMVGAMIAFFIKRLENVTNANPNSFHLIGHSLGAHVSGYAGARIRNPKIGQITGLDPAGPAFQTNDPDVRLDQSDADLVVAIHTDAGDAISEGFGIEAPLGHYDFYPNSGLRQPGCELTRGVSNFLLKGTTGIADTIICNHRRATIFPVADPSIFNTCQNIAYECDSFDKFIEGECAHCGSHGEKCKPFSLLLDSSDTTNTSRVNETQPPKQFFIKTSDMLPFCLYHYQVVVFTANDSSVTTGKIAISLFGQKRDKDNIELTQKFFNFKSSQKYTYLLTYPKDLGLVLNATVNWTFGGINLLNPLQTFSKPAIKIERIEVNFMSHIEDSVRKQLSSTLCPMSDKEIVNGESVHFEICINQ